MTVLLGVGGGFISARQIYVRVARAWWSGPDW